MATQYDRIEQLCKQAGTNVTALCRTLGIARSSLSELHSGRTKSLSSEALHKIAAHFGVTVDYLITGNPPSGPAGEDDELARLLEHFRTRPELRMLFSLTKNATPEDVRAAAQIIELYLNKNGTPGEE